MHIWSKRGGGDRVSTAVDDETGLKRAEVTSYLPQTTAYTPQAAVQRPPTNCSIVKTVRAKVRI